MSQTAPVGDRLPARRGGAKALLLTVLGEFVLPADGEVWTSSLLAAADVLGIGEKNARQAIARIGDQGLIESVRHGRRVRWSLTSAGRELLEAGTDRIYSFGRSTVDWEGHWLMAHCPVAESQRAMRNQLRTRLGFLGFGELSASLLVSPHSEREPQLRAVLADLDLTRSSVVLRSMTGSREEDLGLVRRAWDLEELGSSYESFSATHRDADASDAGGSFRAVVELVHDWRRFPSIDPELPSSLLPAHWAGTEAARVFHDRHDRLSRDARDWFARMEASGV